MEFSQFVASAFLSILSAGVYILYRMSVSISTLDTKIGVIIAKHEQAMDDINDHEKRIRDIERTIK